MHWQTLVCEASIDWDSGSRISLWPNAASWGYGSALRKSRAVGLLLLAALGSDPEVDRAGLLEEIRRKLPDLGGVDMERFLAAANAICPPGEGGGAEKGGGGGELG